MFFPAAKFIILGFEPTAIRIFFALIISPPTFNVSLSIKLASLSNIFTLEFKRRLR